jgi:phosphopantothenoylcysteine decarboxylase/phosphopantothenate--cysteine ligase
MGMALAHECIQAGAKTTLIIGSISIDIEKRAEVIRIVSAEDMYKAVMQRIKSQDLFISCAAVADFRPKNISNNKIKKNNNSVTIELIKNKDILASVCQLNKKPICIGFAAETENFIDNARAKLVSKQCEAIILNDVSQNEMGLNSDENEVHFITKENCEKIEKNSKQFIAEKVIQKIINCYF